jgi:hypothetical protein
MRLGIVIPLALTVSATSPALAQVSFPACESQQEMEQVIQSEGELMPEGCRTVTVTPVDTPAGELCALEFQEEDPGIVGAIAEAAVPTQWWVACADIGRP